MYIGVNNEGVVYFGIFLYILEKISGIVIFRQGWEKFTGDFTLNGLVPVIRDNTDSPQWYKWFFEHIVAHTTGLFNIIVPLGEMAIGVIGILGFVDLGKLRHSENDLG